MTTVKLVDVYTKMYESEKTAAVTKGAGEDLDKVIAALGLTDQVKTAEDREVVKLALSYDAMGREIARQTFVTEIMGQPAEKTAAVIDEILGKGEEKPAEEKVAAAASDEDALLASLGLVEKKAEDKVATDEEKLAELKQAALRELVTKLVDSAKAGVKKAAETLKKIAASSPENKTVVASAIKNHGKDEGKSKGNLAKFIAMKKDKGGKK